MNKEWLGTNPYYLLIEYGAPERLFLTIDLDRPHWLRDYASLMREPGQWYLVRKVGELIVATMRVYDGEQPYYVARHVGFASTDSNEETTSYGIGKKRLDGHVDRLWVMANGCITLGDDVEAISLDLLKSGLL